MLVNLSEFSRPDAYFAMTQTVLPRPVAWVLSENDNGSYNLAPYSFFNAVSSDPPLLMFSVGLQDDGTYKDSLANVMVRPEFVVHIASCDQLPDLNLSSATLPPGVSEVTAGNLSLSEVEGFSMPRLTDCKVAFMCHVHKIDQIGNNDQNLVFGEIDAVYLDDSCAAYNDKGRLIVNADVIQPLSRLGASQYASFGEILTAVRPA